VSVPAYLLSSGRPEYPSEARAARVEADVPLEIVVDERGRVVESTLLRRAGHGFDESALRALQSYRFAPAQRAGVAVRVRMRWTVAFRLE
jgi:TonB family protein